MDRKLIALAVAAGMAPLTSGCAMTVETTRYAAFADQGYDLVIERRTERDGSMMWDDSYDDDRVFAINRESSPLCVIVVMEGGSRKLGWVVEARSERRLWNERISGDWTVSRHSPGAACPG